MSRGLNPRVWWGAAGAPGPPPFLAPALPPEEDRHRLPHLQPGLAPHFSQIDAKLFRNIRRKLLIETIRDTFKELKNQTLTMNYVAIITMTVSYLFIVHKWRIYSIADIRRLIWVNSMNSIWRSFASKTRLCLDKQVVSDQTLSKHQRTQPKENKEEVTNIHLHFSLAFFDLSFCHSLSLSLYLSIYLSICLSDLFDEKIYSVPFK